MFDYACIAKYHPYLNYLFGIVYISQKIERGGYPCSGHRFFPIVFKILCFVYLAGGIHGGAIHLGVSESVIYHDK